jgi:hypothetical protein
MAQLVYIAIGLWYIRGTLLSASAFSLEFVR